MNPKDGSDAAVSVPPSPPRSSWVEKTPGVCGGDACIRKTRITVWGLVEWQKLGLSDTGILEHHPDLTPADLEVAWEYYEHHREEIEQAIRDNEDA
jgi:uncharacterized protein (DUF433 family)